ncbi:MAG: bifunctional proline dehydrogenase/L-glutamate gamma-semialdehyde dehydrogenase [Nocardioides sp.]
MQPAHDLPSEAPSDALALESEVVDLVRLWLHEASAQQIDRPIDRSATRLADLLGDADGLAFAARFIDGVIRPDDARVASRTFVELARAIPDCLPRHLRVAMSVGAPIARIVPGVVIPVVRRVLRRLVGHLVIDATDSSLGAAIGKVRRSGIRLNVNLLGEAVLGPAEAARRLAGTRQLLARPDVDYVSIKVSSIAAPHSPWAFAETVRHVVAQLEPLYRQAAESPTEKFINLDMEEYHDLELTLAVFTTLLDRSHLRGLPAGIVLQAYLPDSFDALIRLQRWASERRAAGGAAIKVRVVKGANLAMERVDASLHGWPLVTWETKQESDTHYKRLLDYALRPEHIESVRIGVAGHNLFDVAFAWLLAGRRGVRSGVDFEMLLGMAPAQADVVRREVGGLVLYTPVVRPTEFDVAIAYLVRRLEEGASGDNFMSAVFQLDHDVALFARERGRFVASLRALDRIVPGPQRTQNRLTEEPSTATRFANTPDTDPALAANRSWGAAILRRAPTSTLGTDLVARHSVGVGDQLDAVVRVARAAGPGWAAEPAAARAEVLRQAGRVLADRRADLIEVMALECGKTLDQADPEVSEAIDFANYYADRAEELDIVDGAVFEPVGLTVVAPPWNFPVAIPAGSTLAALAAGSAVVLKPAPQARRCGAVLADALWSAGVPREVLSLLILDDGELGRQLIADRRVDRVILTGAFETAELFRSFRPEVALLAETSGKNAVVVTPSADLDLAARDVAHSAFGHAGQKCSAASLAIMVGSVADSRRFRQQLVDATRAMVVGPPTDPTTQIGPLIEPAGGKLLAALTELGPGESWLLAPCRLDEPGQLWTPGIRDGVRRGSRFHLTEYFGPVLGLIRAGTLDEAMAIQNDVAFGLTAGLHSLDPVEGRRWLAGVKAGNVYVNRGITGAIVRRQPFGGWKRSSVGPGAKAGGPNYLVGLGGWRRTPARERDAHLPAESVTLLSVLPEQDAAFLGRSMAADHVEWAERFAAPVDVSGLGAERNVLRYLPAEVSVRWEPPGPETGSTGSGSLADLLRCLHAGFVAGAEVRLSAAAPIPAPLTEWLAARGFGWVVETAEEYAAGLGANARIRLVGGDPANLARAVGGRPDVAIYGQPVTESGWLEILPFVREQAVSITGHRFGNPLPLAEELVVSL